jgi:hypothetical protein
MVVLIEAISVVIRRNEIEASYPGGWKSFAADAPNSTLCADSQLARVGFMQPSDVQAYVSELERSGLVYEEGGSAKDIAGRRCPAP